MVVNPFDWEPTLVNEIAGSMTMFIIFLYIIIAYIAAKMRFPNILTLAIMIVITLFMSPFLPSILAPILIIVALIIAALINYATGNR